MIGAGARADERVGFAREVVAEVRRRKERARYLTYDDMLTRLQAALAASEPVRVYQQYVDAYGLVYTSQAHSLVTFPAHEGSLTLQYAARAPDNAPSAAPTPVRRPTSVPPG